MKIIKYFKRWLGILELEENTKISFNETKKDIEINKTNNFKIKETADSLKKSQLSLKESQTSLKKSHSQSNERIAKLEGIVGTLVIFAKSQKGLKQVSIKSQPNFETKIFNKIRNSKKEIIKNEIEKNLNLSTSELLTLIVYEKKMCSRASFFRYLKKVSNKSQKGLKISLN